MAALRSGGVVVLVFLFALPLMAAASLVPNRRLLQTSMKECNTDFSKEDYSEVTAACKDPYPKETCCAAYDKFCAKYKPVINDLQSVCPILFISYLNMAGNYGTGVFMGRCNSGTTICN